MASAGDFRLELAALRIEPGLHGPADLFEQQQALVERRGMLFAVLGDRHTGHMLHREVWQAFFGHPGVEQPRDVRVVQPAEQAPLLEESSHVLLRRDLSIDFVAPAPGVRCAAADTPPAR